MHGDEQHLLAAIELSRSARGRGNQPFGSLLVDADGNVVLEAENTTVTDQDLAGHAELNLMRDAARRFGRDFLAGCTLYASTEPCAMCAGAIYWGNVRRVVFALSTERFLATFAHPDEPGLMLPCRDVFARGGHPVDVVGPQLDDQALEAHQGYWT